jgi:hypothetical protein
LDQEKRFCRDCKHYREDGRGRPEDPICEAPQNYVEHVDHAKFLVTGIEQPTRKAMRGGNCASLRGDRGPEVNATICGPKGKWFELRSAACAGQAIAGSFVAGVVS